MIDDLSSEVLDSNFYEPAMTLYNLVDDIADKLKIRRVTDIDIHYGDASSKEFCVNVAGLDKNSEHVEVRVYMGYDKDKEKVLIWVSDTYLEKKHFY